MKRAFPASAFSLVEVTLALGIVSFVLIALLGLLGVSINASQRSASGTLAPRLVQSMIAKVERDGAPADGTLLTFYFDETGQEKTGAENAAYTLTLSARTPDEETELPEVGQRLRVVIVTIRSGGAEQTVCSTVLIP